MGTRVSRRQRGAAMAEFVLLAPVMIAMWMGINYFRMGYARRLDALGKSQTNAWTRAYANDMSCFRSGANLGGLAGLMANVGSQGGQQAQNAVDTFSGNSNNSSIFLYASSGSGVNEEVSNAHFGLKAGVGGATVVICNEVVPVGSGDQDVLTPMKSFISGVFPQL